MFALAAGHEYFNLTEKIGVAGYPLPSAVLGFFLLLIFYFDGAFLTEWLALAPVVLFGTWLAIDRDTRTVADQMAYSLLGILYTTGAAGFFLRIRTLENGKASLLFLFMIVWFSDIAAYYAGRAYGKTPLAPDISPGKTREGAVAGLLGSLLAAPLAAFGFLPGVSLFACLIVAAVCGIIGQLGDLAESALKRSAHVKDSGTLIPGHGGVLDRIDSLLFAGPVFYVCCRWLL